jgi:hypothetical protein
MTAHGWITCAVCQLSQALGFSGPVGLPGWESVDLGDTRAVVRKLIPGTREFQAVRRVNCRMVGYGWDGVAVGCYTVLFWDTINRTIQR